MSASREDIIDDAAIEIVNYWDEWEAAAGQISQVEQDSDAGDDYLRGKIREVVAMALDRETWRVA